MCVNIYISYACFDRAISSKVFLLKVFFLFAVTPEDYQPPGFRESSTENFAFDEEPTNIRIGDVNTVCYYLSCI